MSKINIALIIVIFSFAFFQCRVEEDEDNNTTKTEYIEEKNAIWVEKDCNMYQEFHQLNSHQEYYINFAGLVIDKNLRIELRSITSNLLKWEWRGFNAMTNLKLDAYFTEKFILLFENSNIYFLNLHDGNILWKKYYENGYSYNFVAGDMICITLNKSVSKDKRTDYLELIDINTGASVRNINIPFDDLNSKDTNYHKKIFNAMLFTTSQGEFISAIYGTIQKGSKSVIYQAAYMINSRTWIYSKNLLVGLEGTEGYQQQALLGSPIIMLQANQKLLYIDGANGTVKSEINFEGYAYATKSFIINNSIYISRADIGLYNIDAKTGTINWFLKSVGGINTILFLDDDIYFVDSFYKRLWRVNHSTGKINWLLKPNNSCCFRDLICISTSDQGKHPVILGKGTFGIQAFNVVE